MQLFIVSFKKVVYNFFRESLRTRKCLYPDLKERLFETLRIYMKHQNGFSTELNIRHFMLLCIEMRIQTRVTRNVIYFFKRSEKRQISFDV